LLRASGLLPCYPNTPQLAAGIFYFCHRRRENRLAVDPHRVIEIRLVEMVSKESFVRVLLGRRVRCRRSVGEAKSQRQGPVHRP
jgi:hypothetical protein